MSATDKGAKAVVSEKSVAGAGKSLKGLTVRRVYSDPSVSPYEALEWDLRTAAITSEKGETIFEQKNVEVPRSWSQTATNIVAQKYFHGRLGSSERESSVKQLIERVVATITGYGEKGGYFATAADRDAFHDELAAILVNQVASFNSPVWFNVGIEKKPQASACFINSCGDSMDSILTLAKTEGMLFKFGSGTGSNLSSLRGSREGLSAGGTASGPLSFMKGFDSFAGAIKSGGKTRRAAKMVILNIDHPDIEDFILSKANEEKKAWALIDAGYDGSFNGEAYSSIFYQNANHSIRVTDEFMNAVEQNVDWWTKEVLTGRPVEKYKARALMGKISEAAWICGDPGMQYDTTINKWNPVKATHRINASNPCFPGDQRVATDKGWIVFRELIERVNRGEEFKVWTHRATAGANGSEGKPDHGLVLSSPTQYMITGVNDVYRVVFDNGVEIRATKNHRFWTVNRGYVPVEELLSSDRVLLADAPIPATGAEKTLPVSSNWLDYREGTDRFKEMTFPKEWSSELGEILGHLIGDGSVGETMLSWVYGTPEDAAELMPRHRAILQEYVGAGSVNECVQANGTRQLRVTRAPFRRFLTALGVQQKRSHEKRIPASLFQASADAQVGFLRGLFGADGCIVNQEAKGTRYAGLGSRSLGLVQDAQKMLLLFGIQSTIYVNENPRTSFEYTTVDGEPRTYAGKATSYDLRITGPSLERFARTIGFSLSRKNEKAKVLVEEHAFYKEDPTASVVDVIYEGPEVTYNLTEPLHHSYVVEGIVVANCSEYMFVDDSACNLASLNLMKFFRPDDGSFDVETFRHASDIIITAQEMLVDNASYPTKAIEENSFKFRPLGLGYANLGALLMATGHAYDSDEGRAYAAAITSLMCGEAYLQSSRIAAELSPFDGYEPNREAFLEVIGMHRDAAYRVPVQGVPPGARQSAQGGLGRRSGIGQAVWLQERPGHGPGAHGHHRLHDGLRHDGRRAGFGLGQVQEAGRRRHDQDRQQHGPSRLEAPGLCRIGYRRDRQVRGREGNDRRRARFPARAPAGLRLRVSGVERHPLDPLHGPRQDDGGRAAVPFGRDLQDREPSSRRDARRDRRRVHGRLEAGLKGGRDLPRRLQADAAAEHRGVDVGFEDPRKSARPWSTSARPSPRLRSAGSSPTSAERSRTSSPSRGTRATSLSVSTRTASPARSS